MPSRIGRSYSVPDFFVLAGARFSVMRLTGNLNPLFLIAARTRSLASLTAASGSPTMSNAGSPLEIKHSTDTGYPLMPLNPMESKREITAVTPFSILTDEKRIPLLRQCSAASGGVCSESQPEIKYPFLPYSIIIHQNVPKNNSIFRFFSLFQKFSFNFRKICSLARFSDLQNRKSVVE